jgi:hypothetical protein
MSLLITVHVHDALLHNLLSTRQDCSQLCTKESQQYTGKWRQGAVTSCAADLRVTTLRTTEDGFL